MEYKPTTNKLGSSKIIKFALIGLSSLFLLRAVGFGMTAWLIRIIQIMPESEQYKINALLRLAELLSVPISASIATIVTAVIARYGLRESTGNIGEGMKSHHDNIEHK